MARLLKYGRFNPNTRDYWDKKYKDGKYEKVEDEKYGRLRREIIDLVDYRSKVLDAGCGRYAERLVKIGNKAGKLIGVDLVDADPTVLKNNIEYYKADLTNIPKENESVDIVISRSVFEHLSEPLKVYNEISRILKPGGIFVFLTPNLFDYVSLLSKAIPNKYHGAIIKLLTGRREKDTFPTYYR